MICQSKDEPGITRSAAHLAAPLQSRAIPTAVNRYVSSRCSAENVRELEGERRERKHATLEVSVHYAGVETDNPAVAVVIVHLT